MAGATVTFLVDVHHIGARQTGNETWARNVARELSARSNEVVFAAAHAATNDLRRLLSAPVHQVSASSARRLAVDLPRLARRLSAGAVLVHYTMPLSRVPSVVVIHDLTFEQPDAHQWMPAPMVTRLRVAARLAARRAAVIVAPSEFTRRGLLSTYDLAPDRVVVAPNSVDPTLASLIGSARSAPAPRRGYDTVLAVGAVLPRKNLSVLGSAIARLRSGGRDVRLRLVGPVPAAGRMIVEQLRGDLGPAVEVVGHVSMAQLAREYVDADALCMPSLFEGFGIPVIEGLTAGLPVIVSDRGALPEVGGFSAVVVAAPDVAGWADAISGVLEAKVADRKHRRPTDQATSFCWSRSAAVVLDALRRASQEGAHEVARR